MPAVPLIAAIGLGTAAAGGVGLATALAQKSQASQVKNAQQAAEQQANSTPGTQVGDTPNTTTNAQNLGRAALISTSPSGVLGTDPTGRRKLLGND